MLWMREFAEYKRNGRNTRIHELVKCTGMRDTRENARYWPKFYLLIPVYISWHQTTPVYSSLHQSVPVYRFIYQQINTHYRYKMFLYPPVYYSPYFLLYCFFYFLKTLSIKSYNEVYGTWRCRHFLSALLSLLLAINWGALGVGSSPGVAEPPTPATRGGTPHLVWY